jgi:hypothetical protein
MPENRLHSHRNNTRVSQAASFPRWVGPLGRRCQPFASREVPVLCELPARSGVPAVAERSCDATCRPLLSPRGAGLAHPQGSAPRQFLML